MSFMTEQEVLGVSSWQDGHRSHFGHTALVGELPDDYADSDTFWL